MRRRHVLTVLATVVMLTAAACGGDGGGAADDPDTVTVYSGRQEALVKPLLEKAKAAGIKLQVRYGDSAELAAQLLEEGGKTKADVFLSQDAGALGALAKEGRLATLAQPTLDQVAAKLRAKDGTWVGVSGRARVLVYNINKVPQSELPASALDLAKPKWKGRIGYAPTNASFQAFVTAMRLTKGEAATKAWLEALKENGKPYERNGLIVAAVNNGEIDAGLVNHYYLYELADEQGGMDKLNARNHFFTGGDPGALVNVSGAGVLAGSAQSTQAAAFVDFLLSKEAQTYFVEETAEYPMTAEVTARADLPKLAAIQAPNIDLADLASLDQTLKLLGEVGLT